MSTIAFTTLTAAEAAQAGIAFITLAVLMIGLLAATTMARRARQEVRRTATDLATAATRLAFVEERLAGTAAELTELRLRLDQGMSQRPAAASAGFRQAIALSRHGATTRQLIDTCGLSQGEAHLIQTLYGRPEPDAAGGLH
jgi:Skp family chaperone for outer membrane proteins